MSAPALSLSPKRATEPEELRQSQQFAKNFSKMKQSYKTFQNFANSQVAHKFEQQIKYDTQKKLGRAKNVSKVYRVHNQKLDE